jgi:two-component system phosphate regulon sensor histidine kinase PhoR
LSGAPGWLQELWRIGLLIVAAGAIGLLFGQVLPALFLALVAYTARNFFNLRRLANWLGDPQTDTVPIHFGLWGDIYARVARVHSRQAQRERRLNVLVNEYAASTAALPDATVALDADGRIRWFNDAASRLLRLQPAKDVGQPLLNLFRSQEVASLLEERRYGRPVQLALPGDRERRLEVRIAPYGEGQVLLLAQEITERLRQERIRKDFVANVSHELRTPLTVLSGFVENLQNDPALNEPRLARPLEVMAQQTARMRRLVEDLLLLARLESEAKPVPQEEVALQRMLESIADDARMLAGEGPEIRLDVRSARRLLGDPQQLRSAIGNLVQNAVHHTPVEGSVTLCWEDDGAESLLHVTDTGEGIAPEHIARLTERFYRVDAGRSRERGGTGLGLAIVKHILNRHDARLEIDSHPGQGSRFSCRFPAARLIG